MNCRRVMLNVLILSVCVAAAAVRADEEKDSNGNRPRPEKRLIKGRVLDQDGHGVKGADVWLPIQFDRTAHTTANAEGHFTLILPEAWIDEIRTRNLWDLWAHAHGHSIGVTSAFTRLFHAKEGDDASERVDITLGKRNGHGVHRT
ncbi:MAG: hypothetical protein H8E66_00135 [Planctomycetes bacterium]|nr:hypothetical protein [Planctomycetota bacterium]